MNKTLKTLFILLFGIFFTFAFAGCSNSNITNNTSDTKQDNSTTSEIETNPKKTDNSNSIVVYFSRTNNTEKIANYIIALTESDSYEILAKVSYTDEDINYNNSNSRTSREQNDPNARPEIGSEDIDLSNYDVIYLGYPIWWGQAPKIMYTFVEKYDLSSKTIIPFCTSASSGIGSSATNLANSATNATWLSGKRFSSSSTKDEVKSWLDSLNY